MATSIELMTEYLIEFCPTCFVGYGLPKALRDKALERREAHSVYCPNGHTWTYLGKSAQKQIEDLKWQVQQKDNRLSEVQAAKTKLEESKKRLERRVHKGVCPYCQRSFANVARHMHSKHAEEKV